MSTKPPPTSEHTFRDMRRLGRVFALGCVILCALTVWMCVIEWDRPWKRYQNEWRNEIEPWMEGAKAEQRQLLTELGEDVPDAAPTRQESALASIHQVEPPGLTRDFHFTEVARIDRCTTCHMGVDATRSSLDIIPAWRNPRHEDSPEVRRLLSTLHGANTQPAWSAASKTSVVTMELDGVDMQQPPELRYGMAFKLDIDHDHAQQRVSAVLPDSPAARAGLQVGDIVFTSWEQLDKAAATPKRIATLKTKRAGRQPFASHPRLDLYVHESSPHPMNRFGCTICHEGEGMATDVARAGHHGERAPTEDAVAMRLSRFIESSCLQCHDDVAGLASNRAFPDAAPKLIEGWRLVRENGCFGCHEMSASANALPRLAWNVRHVADALLDDPAINEEQRTLAKQLIRWPDDHKALRSLADSLRSTDAPTDLNSARSAIIAMHEEQSLTDDAPANGLLRKVGPTLSRIASKLEKQAVVDSIADPTAVREDARMPRFFGLHEHLEGATLVQTQRLETAEIEGIAAYLMTSSRPWTGASNDDTTFASLASIERGREMFFTHGCAACHRTGDYPAADPRFGPDLSETSHRLNTPEGRRWLLGWLRDPASYSPDTTMPNPRLDDPSALLDIAAHLLDGQDGAPTTSPPVADDVIHELASELLAGRFTNEQIDDILKQGLSLDNAEERRYLGDVVELSAPISREKKLRFIGRASVARRGCFACHDIAGFDSADPIGPSLADFGVKRESLLAFENVAELPRNPKHSEDVANIDEPLFFWLIKNHRREGFLWQKLRAPRSFDYQVADAKRYGEHLTMGRFDFAPEEREAIMTFILGLTDKRPAETVSAKSTPRGQAIARGREVLMENGCAACHMLEPARVALRYDPANRMSPPEDPTFAVARPSFTRDQRLVSQAIDRAGLGRAEAVGRWTLNAQGDVLTDEDYDGQPIQAFSPWQPSLVNGETWPVGVMDIPVRKQDITSSQPPWGGAFADRLYPSLVERTGDYLRELWGWGPPPLAYEGEAVHGQWLARYLQSPTTIRPAAVLPMPRYTLTLEENQALTEYFLAVADAPVYETSTTQTAPTNEQMQRWRQTFALVTDRTTFCGKCHALGDIAAEGSDTVNLGPNLADVAERLRREHLKRWIANPRSVLPYTGMPVNFPPEGPPVGQELLPGTSEQQIDAVVDFLLNYDEFAGGKN